jgi:hypothetical protein
VARRSSGGDHQGVGPGRAALEFDDDDVFGLVVVERDADAFEQRVVGRIERLVRDFFQSGLLGDRFFA